MFSGFAVVFLVFFGAICVIAVVVVGSVARIRIGGGPHYRRQLRDWATARDWTYHEDDGGEWTSLLPKGDGLGGWGVKLQLDGTRQGRQVTVAHYWYRKTETARDGGTSLHTANVPVIVVRLATRYPAVALQIRRPSRLFPVVFPVVPWAAGLPASVTGVAEFDRGTQGPPGRRPATVAAQRRPAHRRSPLGMDQGRQTRPDDRQCPHGRLTPGQPFGTAVSRRIPQGHRGF
jgi:hypothetical protein